MLTIFYYAYDFDPWLSHILDVVINLMKSKSIPSSGQCLVYFVGSGLATPSELCSGVNLDYRFILLVSDSEFVLYPIMFLISSFMLTPLILTVIILPSRLKITYNKIT